MKTLTTFTLGDLLFGVDVAAVQEVIRPQTMTPVPLAADAVGGLINLRGQVVTAVDLRRRLDLPAVEGQQPSMNVVVRTAGGAVSLLVDTIGDVVETDEADFEQPPETLAGRAREVVLGAYKLEGRLLLAIDVDRAVDVGTQVPA